ncbi:hypothetical protein FORC37_2865 [Vibrio vulnificus]|nr:hypothetical protein FORC37_2865 [Vibrio vulnificus]
MLKWLERLVLNRRREEKVSAENESLISSFSLGEFPECTLSISIKQKVNDGFII